jgi:hypothetical protein
VQASSGPQQHVPSSGGTVHRDQRGAVVAPAAGAVPGQERQQLEALQLDPHQAQQLTHRLAGHRWRWWSVSR